MLSFNSTPYPTIGVELELQLIDPGSCELKNIAPEVLRRIQPDFRERIKCEFLQSMIELNTRVCKDLSEVERDLKESIAYLETVLSEVGADYFCAGIHPFSKGADQALSDHPRYRRIMDDLQIVGRRFITQGLHVHIGVEDPEVSIKINNALRIHLPLLLTLSTSSPFYEGVFTGLFSYRTKLFESLPLAGMPDSLDGWNEFAELTMLLQKGGIIESVKDLWWDVRPHPDFGTVEIRICDAPFRLRDILAITALIQALVATISSREFNPDTHIQILRANKWQAARYGHDGIFVDPVDAKRYPIRDAVTDLCTLVEPEADRLGSTRYLEGVKSILSDGTGADLMMRLYSETGDLRVVIRRLKEGFLL